MAIDKAVDSAALDAALAATADAIRAKGGGTAKIAWDAADGFAGAVKMLPDKVNLDEEMAVQVALLDAIEAALDEKGA